MKIAMILTILFSVFLVGNAMAWNSIYVVNPVNPAYSPSFYDTNMAAAREAERSFANYLQMQERTHQRIQRLDAGRQSLQNLYRAAEERDYKRKLLELREREVSVLTLQMMHEVDYQNRHSSIYISGCHHYSESCRMQLQD